MSEYIACVHCGGYLTHHRGCKYFEGKTDWFDEVTGIPDSMMDKYGIDVYEENSDWE